MAARRIAAFASPELIAEHIIAQKADGQWSSRKGYRGKKEIATGWQAF